jgi:facilitated trehalose transporter
LTLIYNYLNKKKQEDPLQQGYSRVVPNPDGTLSSSTTSTSLDTVVVDTSADNISSSPKLQKQKPRTFSPILESEDTSNPFAEDIKELAIRTKQGIKFDDEEEGDRFDEEEAFKKKREHFQKTKSRSEHKSILLKVSSMLFNN